MQEVVELAGEERREADEEEQQHDAHEPHGLLDAALGLGHRRR